MTSQPAKTRKPKTARNDIDDCHNEIPQLNRWPTVWGPHTVDDLNEIINAVYEEIVFWKSNIFHVPTGAVGKEYVKEMRRLLNAWNEENKYLNAASLKALMIM